MTQRDKIFALAKFHGGTPSNITDNAYLISIYSNLNTLMQMVIDINKDDNFHIITINTIDYRVRVVFRDFRKDMIYAFHNKETLVIALQNAIYEAIQPY